MAAASNGKAVRDAEEARCKALIAADSAALDRLFTSDYIYVHSSGRVEGRASYIATQTSGANNFKSFEHSDLKIDMLGSDAALMTGTVQIVREKGTVLFLFSEVWVNEGGTWRLKYQQNTKKTA